MEDGKVIQSGTYENLLTAGTAFEQLVNAHKDAVTELNQDNENKRGSENDVYANPQDSHPLYLTKNQSEGEISTKDQLEVQLTKEEEKDIGDVGWKPFWDYISYSRMSYMLCFILLAQSTFMALQTASSFWLAIAIEIPKVTSATLIGVYSLISFASILFVYLRSHLNACLGLKASTAFFSSFTTAIFNSPMMFFDSTPIGRILTRVRFIHLFLIIRQSSLSYHRRDLYQYYLSCRLHQI
jgi:ABC-type bacteriocin/lantibiotic exporter with double-glycine peptidase domain